MKGPNKQEYDQFIGRAQSHDKMKPYSDKDIAEILDYDQPITAEWCYDNLPDNPFMLGCARINGKSTIMLGGESLLNVKTRGDLRMLCRLLGVELKC